jgi:triosephosphate isomerase
VGESLEENEAERTEEVVFRQVKLGLEGISLSSDLSASGNLVIAYEPVWAIGTGRAATAEGANKVVAQVIRPALAELFGEEIAQEIRVLYGGSVKADNAAEFFSQPDIDGALVGGASLKVSDFVPITQAAAQSAATP